MHTYSKVSQTSTHNMDSLGTKKLTSSVESSKVLTAYSVLGTITN